MGTSVAGDEENQQPIGLPTVDDVDVKLVGVFDPTPVGEQTLGAAILSARTQLASNTFVSPQVYGYTLPQGGQRDVCRIEIPVDAPPLFLLCTGLWVPPLPSEG